MKLPDIKYKKPRMPRSPIYIEREYKMLLFSMIEHWAKVVKDSEDDIQRIIDRKRKFEYKDTSLDSWVDDIEKMMKFFAATFSSSIKRIAKKIFGFGKEVNKNNKKNFINSWLDSVGTNPPYTPQKWVDTYLDNFYNNNLTLIKNISDDTLKEIRTVFDTHIRANSSARSIVRDIVSKTTLKPLPGISYGKKANSVLQKKKKRAQTIATDQIGKLNSDLKKKRSLDVGLYGYEWVTMRDERVRGKPGGKYPNARPSHWARNGKFYLWDYSNLPPGGIPEGYEKGPPSDGNPGYAIGCRCYGRSDFRWIL